MKTDRKNNYSLNLIFIAATSCLLYAVSSGIRANYGIMINGISQNSGLAYSYVSFVLAVAQLVYGITQPLFGIAALKKSNLFVLITGAILMVVGIFGIPFCHSMWTLLVCIGFLLATGTGALSFGIIMGASTPLMTEKEAATISGIVTAGSGVGSTILSPVIQKLIAGSGLQAATSVLCIPILLLIPVSYLVFSKKTKATPTEKSADTVSLRSMLANAFCNKSYLFLMTGFFTCGFHMAIIETHLFSQFVSYGLSEEAAARGFAIYGIAVIIGSVISGILDSRFPMKNVLGSIYAFRVVIVLMLLTFPRTCLSLYFIAILLGLTAASTVPPTSGLVSKLFGAAQMATLFGIVFFSHQIGSFFSSWFGGICVQKTGAYALIWIASMIFSTVASIVSFSIKESAILPR